MDPGSLMAPSSHAVLRAFTGGEISPALATRADLAQYVRGLKTCRNCWPHRLGGVVNRPGFRFIAEVKDSGAATRIIPFVFRAGDQSFIIELGNLYARFYFHGAPVMDGPDPYEIATPYITADLAGIQFAQSIDVLILTHPTYAPRELRRVANDDWTLTAITLGSSIAAPANPTGITGTVGTRTFRYVCTAAKAGTYEESLPGAVIEITLADEGTVDTPHALSADPVTEAAEYYWYKDPYENGYFGLIGASAGPEFLDVGFAPDFTNTPPVGQSLFTGAGEFPGAVTHYQQRRIFARSDDSPESVWASRVGAYHNFNISTPLKDDDAVTFIIAGTRFNPVAHLVPLKRLVVMTDEGSHIVRGDESGTLKPQAINVDQEGYVGADPLVRPVTVGEAILYVQNGGQVVRDLSFVQRAEREDLALAGRDLTMMAGHLFDGYTVVDLALALVPHSIVWAVRSDGTLLGLSYHKEQDIAAWHRHDTGASGLFEHVAVIPNDATGEDDLYVVVQRTIDSATVRYIEKLETRHVTAAALADAFFVDSGLTYAGAAATVMTGLDHLEGEVVAVFGNGAVVFDGDPAHADAADFTVASGQITLAASVTTAQIGLPIRFADIETLALDVDGSDLRGKRKRVQSLSAVLHESSATFRGGRVFADTMPILRTPTFQRPANGLHTDTVELSFSAKFDDTGHVCLRHTAPMPLHVLAVIPQIEVGE